MRISDLPTQPDPSRWIMVLVNQALDDLDESRLTPEQVLRQLAVAAWDAGWDAAL